MSIGVAIIYVLIGFVLLVKGADWFVDGAAGVARKLRVPALIIGLTIVSFGTSAPEFATSVIASVQGDASIAVGNLLGSNIANILLILGLAAVIAVLPVGKDARRMDLPVLLGSTVLFTLLGLDGAIGRVDGVILTVVMVVYTTVLIVNAIRHREDEPSETAEAQEALAVKKKGFSGWYEKMKEHAWFLSVAIVVGLGLVIGGAFLVKDGAVVIAQKCGVSERIIGLTVVAIGTSLPELVTCVIAAMKGDTDIAVGDIVGSNIFNLIRTGGIAAIIYPLAFESSFLIDGAIAFGAAALITTFGYMKGNKIRRWGGIVMLCAFVAYYVYLFAV